MSSPRRQAREAALQILYFVDVGRAQPQTAIDAFFAGHQPEADERVRRFASTLVHGTTAEAEAIDRLIEQHSRHWRLARLAIVDRLILRMAVWELQHEPDTPPAAVLNEALDLARRFSSDEAVSFVNGVLDAIRRATDGEPAAGAPEA